MTTTRYVHQTNLEFLWLRESERIAVLRSLSQGCTFRLAIRNFSANLAATLRNIDGVAVRYYVVDFDQREFHVTNSNRRLLLDLLF